MSTPTKGRWLWLAALAALLGAAWAGLQLGPWSRPALPEPAPPLIAAPPIVPAAPTVPAPEPEPVATALPARHADASPSSDAASAVQSRAPARAAKADSADTGGHSPEAAMQHKAPAPYAHAPRRSASSPAPEFLSAAPRLDALNQAYALLSAGQLDEARRRYLEVLQAFPEERDALAGLAHIDHRLGHRHEALERYQRVLRQDPDNPSALAGVLALSHEAEPAQAVSVARELTQRHPASAAAWATLGAMLARDGRLADSAQALARAQALEPQRAPHAYNLAVALDRLHQYPQAQGAYERALTLSARSIEGIGPGFSRTAAQQRLDQLRATATPLAWAP